MSADAYTDITGAAYRDLDLRGDVYLAIEASRVIGHASRRWLIVEPTDARPLTVNAVINLHRQKWANHTRDIRGRWHLLAVEAGIPHLARARFTVLPLHKNMASPQDVAACAPEFKPALDGLVDAGVLDDDGDGYVAAVTFLPPLRGCGHNGMAVLIEEVGA